jgi:RNA polymerase sigma factor (TIGR02999 family)
MANLTALLNAWSSGDESAGDVLIHEVYPAIRRLAAQQLSSRRDVSLSATEIVHEVYLKLAPPKPEPWANRLQFFAYAARLVRQVLVDHARRKHGKKRSAHTVPIELVTELPAGMRFDDGLLAVDDALNRLAALDADAARIVELRFFAGLTLEETAVATGLSRTSVVVSWRHARAWLRAELRRGLDSA